MQVCFLASATRLVSRTSTSVHQFTRSQPPTLRLTQTPKILIKCRLSDVVTGRTWERCGSLIWVCMWQRRCQRKTRQHFIHHQRRVWSVPLTLDFKRLEMSSGNNQTPPLPPTPPRLIQSQFWAPSPLLVQVLSSCLKTKTMYTNASSPPPWMYGCSARSVGRERWQEQENGSDPNPREIVNTRWRGTANTWQQQGPARADRGGHKAPSGKCM